MIGIDLITNRFFTTTGEDIWKVEWYFTQPSCRLKNLETGDVEEFGMGGLTAQKFHRIEMPIKPKEPLPF